MYKQITAQDVALTNRVLEKHSHAVTGYGPWLMELTDTTPWEPKDSRLWTSLTEKEMNDLCAKKKIPHELPEVGTKVLAMDVVKRILDICQEKGLFEGFLLPFEVNGQTLITGNKFDVSRIYLNYGENGKGGQRCPKIRHILNMIRQWNPNKLTSGLARVDSKDRVFVNEGQQRTLAGIIVGRTQFPYDYEISDDTLVDTRQFIGENRAKLQASPVEIIYSTALEIETSLVRAYESQGKHVADIKVEDAVTMLGIDSNSPEYKDWKMYKYLEEEGITMYNEKHEKENDPKALTSISQLNDIFDTYEDDIIKDALHLNGNVWSQRPTETADIIGWCETLTYNKKRLYEELDEFERAAVFARWKRAIIKCWKNGKHGVEKGIWSDMQDQRKLMFPRKTVEDREQNSKYYDVASRRIAHHLWIAQGFYSVLTQTLRTLPNGDAEADALVQPYSLPSKEKGGDQGGQTIPFEITWGLK